ncbi:MAG: SDR family NAD(P)-dependent oxidoreductase [Candidatus Omnitrophota bacterium]
MNFKDIVITDGAVQKGDSMKVFISGVSSGLGLALAEDLIRRGNAVWGIGRRAVDTFRTETLSSGLFRYFECDTTDGAQVKNVFNKMLEEDFIPDTAVFCAGSATDDIVEKDFRGDKFRENFNVNLFGALCWVELLLPHFIKRNKGIFAGISSMSIFRENHEKRIGYSASRVALNKTFENLRMQYINTALEFVIFNMGRMREKRTLIGTSYAAAARFISEDLRARKTGGTVNVPFSQYLLTRMTEFLPDKVYHNFFRR